MKFEKVSAKRVEKLHNLLIDAITSRNGKDRKRPFTLQEVVVACELVKSEVIYQHLLKEYSIKIDTDISEPRTLKLESTREDEKPDSMILVK